MSRHHIVNVELGGNLIDVGLADQVRVEVKKDCGSLNITVTDEGNIVLDLVDGKGEVIDTACLDPDDFVTDDRPETEGDDADGPDPGGA